MANYQHKMEEEKKQTTKQGLPPKMPRQLGSEKVVSRRMGKEVGAQFGAYL